MIDYKELPVAVEPMRLEDIGRVLEIERQSFTAPWSARAYEYELRYNELAHYYVARARGIAARPNSARAGWSPREWLDSVLHPEPPPPDSLIVGYIGFWLMAGEAHISTIAVDPAYRGRSIGELLLVSAMDQAADLHATEATLEVRVSNTVAQELYLKYGYVKVGVRKGYYSDNNEDAIIMTTPPINSPDYQMKFSRLKEALLLRLRDAAWNDEKRGRPRLRGGSSYG